MFSVDQVAAALRGQQQGSFRLNIRASNQQEAQFASRIVSHLQLRQNLEVPARIDAAKRHIPSHVLQAGSCEAVVRALLKWFKHTFMKPFVTSVACSVCQGATVAAGAAPPTPAEQAGQANMVELHRCQTCQYVTRFPRYNDMMKVMETRLGRCGEWAQCFTLFLRAAGIEARLVLDFTDHLWSEAKVDNVWIMCDPCEEAYDAPLMYESGWGKKLHYIFAYDRHSIVDVARRYTQNWPAMAQRRNMVPELFIAQTLNDLNNFLANNVAHLGLLEQQRLQSQLKEEQALLESSAEQRRLREEELRGRQTGSEEWRRARGELGTQQQPPQWILFQGGTVSKMHHQVVLHSEQMGLSSKDLDDFADVFLVLSSPSKPFSESNMKTFENAVKNWPRDKIFPVLDALRLVALRNVNFPSKLIEDLVQLATSDHAVNSFLSLRILANLASSTNLQIPFQTIARHFAKAPFLDERCEDSCAGLCKNIILSCPVQDLSDLKSLLNPVKGNMKKNAILIDATLKERM